MAARYSDQFDDASEDEQEVKSPHGHASSRFHPHTHPPVPLSNRRELTRFEAMVRPFEAATPSAGATTSESTPEHLQTHRGGIQPPQSSYYNKAQAPHSRYNAYMQPTFSPPADASALSQIRAIHYSNRFAPFGSANSASSAATTSELPRERNLPAQSTPYLYHAHHSAHTPPATRLPTKNSTPEVNSMYRYPSAQDPPSTYAPEPSSEASAATNNKIDDSASSQPTITNNLDTLGSADQDEESKAVATAILNVATGGNLSPQSATVPDNQNESTVEGSSNSLYHETNPQDYSTIMAAIKQEKLNSAKKQKQKTDTGSGRGRGRGRGGGGRGRGRGRGRGKKAKSNLLQAANALNDGSNTIIADSIVSKSPVKEGAPAMPPPKWYAGHVALGLDEDKFWLSELQVYLRSNFAEAFGATERDIAAPMHGRNKPIALGQVGIRCMHCRDDPPGDRGQQAVSYPSLISGIYNSVQQMFRLHFDCCLAMPSEVRRKIETLRASSSSRGGRKQYWIDSAKRLGLVDTPHGIHFGRDPNGPLPPLSGPSAGPKSPKLNESKKEVPAPNDVTPVKDDQDGSLVFLTSEHTEAMKKQKENAYPLVLGEDKPLISDYLFLTLEQMEPCNLMDADRVGCYKGREVGFPGLACKHCVGQAGCGRYFPASEASLSQTTTSQTILNHVRNCRRCPIEIRENLELMKRAKLGPNGKKFDKPKHGGRKVFFHRLWCRIQGLPINEDCDVEVKVGRQKGAKNKKPKKSTLANSSSATKRKRKSSKSTHQVDIGDDDPSMSDASDRKSTLEQTKNKENSSISSGSDDDIIDDNDDDEETETEDEEDEVMSDDSDSEESHDNRNKGIEMIPRNSLVSNDGDESILSDGLTESEKKIEKEKNWYQGCVPLSRPDDPHWLSETRCFVRSDMVEAFTINQKDSNSEKYDKNLRPHQVGIRCKFCAKLPLAFRPKGHVYFPSSIAFVYQAIVDLQRRHFTSCNQIPDDIRETYRSLRGFAAKAEGDTQQYWVDSARELGLCDIVGGDGGIRFLRDPLSQSPADRLEVDMCKGLVFCNRNLSLIRPEDKEVATDQALLLLLQVRPCRFKNNDRRGGPGSRGRDRALGFPGIACIHCPNKNSIGRYFPVAAKTLADNTANSIQAHLMNCTRCPDSVKASLSYLQHRSSLQKVELGGGWKRTFFKRLWDRLHHERVWAKPVNKNDHGSLTRDIEDDSGENDETSESNESIGKGAVEKNKDVNDDKRVEDSGSDVEDMVRAAAIWLSERDADDSLNLITRSRGGRGRGLPGRFRHNSSGRGRGVLSSKRQRVL